MPTAWALLVVSSDAQAETLQHQRAWAQSAAKERGWHLTRFVEGVASGKDGPRRLTRDILLEVRAAPPEARPAFLLMIRLDRVGRGSIVDSQIFVRDLLALGARVFTRDAGEIRLDSAMDELVAAVQMAVARHENDVRRDKARAVYKRRVAAGQITSNRAPYGLALTPDRRYEARPEYAPAIRQAFKMRARGVRMMDVVRWMQGHSEPHRYKNGHEYQVRWSDHRLRAMLGNRGYIGTVVDQATWLRAQRARVERAVGRSPQCDRIYLEFVLAGALRCVCGRSLSGVRSIRPGRVLRYYVCRAGWTHKSARYHRARDLEDRFVVFLRRLADSPASTHPTHTAKLERLERDAAAIRGRLDVVERGRARIWDLDDRGHLDPRDLAQRLSDLNARRAALETQLVAVLEECAFLQAARERDTEAEALRRNALDSYLAANAVERTAIARAVAASLGGLRVTMAGRIVIGARLDFVWQRKRKAGEF